MLARTRNIKAPKATAFTLIFAGGMGNVTDFIDLADVWITAGVALLALSTKPKTLLG